MLEKNMHQASFENRDYDTSYYVEKSVEKYGYGAKQMKSIPQFYCTNFVERYKRQAGGLLEWSVKKSHISRSFHTNFYF